MESEVVAETLTETIPSVLRDAAKKFGDAEAVADGDLRVSFAELLEQAEAVAAALVGSGVEPGDRVAIWAPNSGPWIIASFGVYLAGGALVPLNTRYKSSEAAHVLQTAEVKLLLTVTDFLGADYVAMLDEGGARDTLDEIVVLAGAPRDGTVAWTDFLRRGADVDRAEVRRRADAVRPDDTSDIIFTSGTTGAPKGAMLGHGASVRTYRVWSELVGLREGDRFLAVYPFFHTAGLKSSVLASVLTGATIIPEPVFDVATAMAKVAAERISMLPGPPTVFQTILDDPDLGTYDLSSLRLSVTGAAVVPVQIIEQMRRVLKFENVVTGYGLTETTGTVSMCRHDDPAEVIATTVGKPLPGVEVRVVDDDGNDLAPGEPGEFLVRGFNVMQGYFNNPAATAEAIVDGWLSTGDIGYVDGDGNLLITDRKKDMFIVGGFNAYPAEIEKMMLDHPDISQVAVVGVPDDRLGEIGIAFVVAASGHTVEPAEVVTWCRGRWPTSRRRARWWWSTRCRSTRRARS